jgi:hypothetical protein
MFKKLSVIALFNALTLTGGLSVARAAEAAPPPPPELKKTVDAFAGKWVYDTTVTMPGGKPVKTKLTVDCKKTALGKATTCRWSGNIPGDGPFEGTAVVGYDTFGKAVHFMGIFSDEEVHDHKCTWKGNTLGCELLKGGMGGGPITEDLSFTFDGNASSFNSVCTFADGGKATFEGKATRSK